MRRLSETPYWTDADAAELEAQVAELVRAIFDHRGRCALCIAGFPPCPRVRDAIEVVVDWRDRRATLSRARWLRLRQELAEVQAELALLERGRVEVHARA